METYKKSGGHHPDKKRAPFIDTIIYTHHGPVVYDESFIPENKKQNYALRWVAHEKSNEAYSFYLLNRASNYEEFNEALDHFACPAQNFAFCRRQWRYCPARSGKISFEKRRTRQVFDGWHFTAK